MDIDATQPARNSPFIHFFDVTSNFPWQEPRPEQIRLRRALLDDTLIFDILLSSGGVGNPYVLYPPENPDALQRLLDAIESSNYDSLKKDCLIYFLLKWHQDGRERTFQEQRCIPPQFVALADAYWHLDTGVNVPRAVALLADTRLNRDYASKIIRAISLSPEPAPLIRRYIQTAKPPLVEPPDIECYALALADFSILDAWQFARTFNERDPTRTRLLLKIFEWIISPEPRPHALKQLISLPLSPFEENILNDFVQKPPVVVPTSYVVILQDLICTRLLQCGRYNEAITLDRLFTSTTPQKHLKSTRDRSKMVQDVYNALPAVEKALLDMELDPTTLPQQPLPLKHLLPETERRPAVAEQDMSLSQSWEEVRVPEMLVPKSTPLRDVRVPLVTPRFGTETTPRPPPILPVKTIGLGSISTSNKSLPLAASVLNLTKPRLSGVGSRLSSGTSNAIASPASGIKFPSAPLGSSHDPHNFISASRQQNAFYQPPVKSNGIKRAFEDDTNKSLDAPELDVDMDVEPGDESFGQQETKQGQKSDEEENLLQYSVFGTKSRSPKRVGEVSKKKARQKTPPGSFGMDEEDTNEDLESDRQKKTVKTRSGRPTRANTQKTVTATSSKPPAKRARQSSDKDLMRSIPGGLMEEDEDEGNEEQEDQVAPLPVRKSRLSRAKSSADTADEMEGGVKTRRRSSRLSATGSGGSNRGLSPELTVAPKARKRGKTNTGTKKR